MKNFVEKYGISTEVRYIFEHRLYADKLNNKRAYLNSANDSIRDMSRLNFIPMATLIYGIRADWHPEELDLD